MLYGSGCHQNSQIHTTELLSNLEHYEGHVLSFKRFTIESMEHHESVLHLKTVPTVD
jgi:hypothetical protein